MRFKKQVSAILAGLMAVTALAGCAGSPAASTGAASGSTGAATGTVSVDFWTAPQVVQYNYWIAKAKAFNETKTVVNGKTISVKVQQMPESPSSEAGIQNSIVTGTVPAASENINRGFATTLAASDAIYDLQDEDWFKEAAAAKGITDSISSWKIEDKQYVLPEYVNPMLWQWNSKGLKALGFKNPPTTVSEFDAVLKAFTDNKDKMTALGINHTLYRPSLSRGDQWWDRWQDFQMPYMALSGKTAWVEGDKLMLDRQGAIDAFELIGKFGNTIQTAELSSVWTDAKPSVLVTINAPWEIQSLRAAKKTYGMDGDYVYGSPIVKKTGDTPYNYGDAKGIVLYKNDAISSDEHLGAVEFMKWCYGKKNSTQTDLDWLNATTMLPVRGDIATNAAFADVMKKYPELKDLAKYIPSSVPCMASQKMTEIQTALTESGLAPYMKAVKAAGPLNPPDASKDVDAAFSAMKQAGELQ